MRHVIESVPVRPVGRVLAAVTVATLTMLVAGAAIAQQPAPAAKPAAKPVPHPAATQSQATPVPQAPTAQAPAGQDQQVQLIYSPWTKFCLKGQDPNAKQVCFTGKDGRIESGMPLVAAVLIEPEGEPKKILRVTLPLGMQLVHGTRVFIDQGQPMNMPYVICFTNGCMSDYDVSPDMLAHLKKGQNLVVQGINYSGQPISLSLPLAEFAKAYDGPPTDPKEFEAQQQKLQEELQRRADEARKKLENQGQGKGQAPAPATPGAPSASAK